MIFQTWKLTENEKLAKYARTGDLELLGQVYADYMHLVFGVCLKYFKNKDDAQDGVIQVFEKLVVDLKKHSVTNFKSWLYVTSKNFCLIWFQLDRVKSAIQNGKRNLKLCLERKREHIQ